MIPSGGLHLYQEHRSLCTITMLLWKIGIAKSKGISISATRNTFSHYGAN